MKKLVSMLLILSILTSSIAMENKQRSFFQKTADYVPAVAGGSFAALTAAASIYSKKYLETCLQNPTPWTIAAAAILAPISYVGSAWCVDKGMQKAGHKFKRYEATPNKNNKTSWWKVAKQVLHPKNVGLMPFTVATKFGYYANENKVGINSELRKEIYRSAQPNKKRWLHYLKNNGLACYISFRNTLEKGFPQLWQMQRSTAQEEMPDLNMHNIPFRGQIFPTPENVEEMLIIIHNPDNYPMHVNCMHGKDRTGLFCALARMELNQGSLEDVMEELGYEKCSHIEAHLPKMKAFIRAWHAIRQQVGFDNREDALEQYQEWYDQYEDDTSKATAETMKKVE